MRQHGESFQVTVGTTRLSGLRWPPSARRVGVMLLVHGARGSAEVWWRVAPSLSRAGNDVVAVDLPGHGGSPSEPALVDIEDLAAVVGRVPAAVGAVEHLIVVGTSLGAIVAAHLPAPHIGALDALVAVEPPAVGDGDSEHLRDELRQQPGPTLADTRARVATWHPDWPTEDQEVKARALHRADPAMLQAIIARNQIADGGLAALRRAQQDGAKVWLLHGDQDRGSLTSERLLTQSATFLPPDRIVRLSGAGHTPQRTHADGLAEVLTDIRGRVG